MKIVSATIAGVSCVIAFSIVGVTPASAALPSASPSAAATSCNWSAQDYLKVNWTYDGHVLTTTDSTYRSSVRCTGPVGATMLHLWV